MKRQHLSLATLLGIVLPLLLTTACGDDSSTKPRDSAAEHLAGGGRDQGDDPFAGGPDGSGPTNPDFEYPDPGFVALFYSESDCSETPGTQVIRSTEEWTAWWADATSCTSVGGDGTLPDSLNPSPGEQPAVDFETNVVLTIRLAPEQGFGRGVWVSGVASSGSERVVTYQVSRLGEDCFDGRDSLGFGLTSPVIAVMVPRPVDEPVRWDRVDIVFNCSWEPDPNEPVALYYTDADCDLGGGEEVIRDQSRLEEWLEQAFACDQARWGDVDSTMIDPGTGAPPRPRFGLGDRDSFPPEPAPPLPPPSWIGIDVDFTKFAVLILRAGAQTRWGGGVWLDAIRASETGTAIDYTVMEPAGECPPIDGGAILRPTVAIRVPLPVSDPVTWNRRTESIDCGWRDGGPGTGTEPAPPQHPRRTY